ncbi:MAG TPA: hypothetical protein VFT72_15095 [Opitutaceae bacterium]|nr:hypothetical protein [Opitutaceae bacterium]
MKTFSRKEAQRGGTLSVWATKTFFGRKEAQKSAKRIFVRPTRLRHSSLGSGLVFWFGVTNQYLQPRVGAEISGDIADSESSLRFLCLFAAKKITVAKPFRPLK